MLLNREIDLHPHPDATPDVVASGIAAELKRHGNRITRVAGGVIEFRGPGMYTLTSGFRERAATLVGGGVVTVDPAAPRARIELRLSALPLLMLAGMGVMMALESDIGLRVFALLALPAVTLANLLLARSAYTRWTRDGARRAALPATPPAAPRVAP